MKVAIATTSKYEAVEFRKLLFKKYTVEKSDETIRDGLYISTFTTNESNWKSILKMFDLIETITGINPYTQKPTKKRQAVIAKRIAGVILRRKYGMTTVEVARILSCSHVSIADGTKGIYINHLKHLPLELAIRLIIRQIREKCNTQNVTNSNSQVQ